MKVRILFARSNGLVGKFIRFFTWSDWNHVAIEIDGAVFDSTVERGVGVNSFKQFKQQWASITTYEIDIPKPQRAKEFLMDQRGKPYDIGSIFGFVFRKDWANPDKWFCSDLVFMALSDGGLRLPSKMMKKSNRITPRDIKLLIVFLTTGRDER